MLPCRLLFDLSQDGPWNMAVDEVLLDRLDAAPASGAPVRAALRFYSWSEPTLSLGYFQSAADRLGHAASAACPLVRRATGGGAILHDRELTYCLVLPGEHPLASRSQPLYEVVHQSLVATLANLGIPDARLHGCDGPGRDCDSSALLCFQRRTAVDVVCGGAKIAGSAQRRKRDGVMQHGSILLAASEAAPELPGISEAAGRRLTADELATAWAERMADALSLVLVPGDLEPDEGAAAERLAGAKYADSRWTYRR